MQTHRENQPSQEIQVQTEVQEGIHYKNATFYIMHFHVREVRPEYNFHLSPGNTKESGSLCYAEYVEMQKTCVFPGTSLISEDCCWISHLDKWAFF
jgi:hypothetical protein